MGIRELIYHPSLYPLSTKASWVVKVLNSSLWSCCVVKYSTNALEYRQILSKGILRVAGCVNADLSYGLVCLKWECFIVWSSFEWVCIIYGWGVLSPLNFCVQVLLKTLPKVWQKCIFLTDSTCSTQNHLFSLLLCGDLYLEVNHLNNPVVWKHTSGVYAPLCTHAEWFSHF